MKAIDLWFARERDVARCYAHEREREGSREPDKFLPTGEVIGESADLSAGIVFCEILDEANRVIGFTSWMESPQLLERFFEGAVNARIIENDNYLVALGSASEDLDYVECRYRTHTPDSVCLSCGFDFGNALQGGGVALWVIGSWEWVDRDRRILRVAGEDSPAFSRPVPLVAELKSDV